jgi:hypothetical protein
MNAGHMKSGKAENMCDESEYVTATQAREMLGIGRGKLAELIENGILPTTESPLNKRMKLIKRSDLAPLLALPRPKKRPRRSVNQDGD